MKIFKAIAFSLLTFLFIVVLIFSLLLSTISKYLTKDPNYLIEIFYEAIVQNPYQSQDKINFLLLGLDERSDALEQTQVTDTIIFASLNLKNLKLNLISTPRDLWFYQKETKINALYPLALESGENKFDYLKDNFEILYGQKIDHVLIVSTDQLINFVDVIGGVDLYLEKGFIDTQYPNQAHIDNPTAGYPIYQTVSFPDGLNHLDSTNVTAFVRSRKSSQSVADGGTDLGRIYRQQLLIEALLNKIKKGDLFSSPSRLKNLYNFWQQIPKTLTDTDAFRIAFVLKKELLNISLNKIELPIGEEKDNSLIYHPTNFINPQWVFITRDEQYQALQDFISTSIK